MSSRHEQLSELQNYIKDVDKEVTMILQSLQWDRKLLQVKPKETCKYNSNHKIPPEHLKEHEDKCLLKCEGYASDDVFLPDVFDPNSSTVMKLTSGNVQDIINYASKTDPMFKRSDETVESEPRTLNRLQATYTGDERRAIYDVVISSRPACDELSDLALGDTGGPSQGESKRKSKIEQLAELRDMRRRRTKYRVAVHSCNYSHTLRALIDTQMEMYAEAHGNTQKKLQDKSDCTNSKEQSRSNNLDKTSDTPKHRGIGDRSRHDRRNYHCENETRKGDHEDHRKSRNFEKHKILRDDRDIRDDRKKHERQTKSKEYYRDEAIATYYNDTNLERNKTNIKAERDSDSLIQSPRYTEYEKYTKDKGMNYIKEETNCTVRRENWQSDSERKESYHRDKCVNYIKEERDRHSSSNSRDIQKYPDSKRMERYYKNKDKNNINAERDRHSTYSSDSQRNRERDRDEQYYRDKDKYGYRNDRIKRR